MLGYGAAHLKLASVEVISLMVVSILELPSTETATRILQTRISNFSSASVLSGVPPLCLD